MFATERRNELGVTYRPCMLTEFGDYYIRIVNRKTGAVDRSDKSFRVAEPNEMMEVDLKIKSADGVYSDEPLITLDTRNIQILWSSKNAAKCTFISSSFDTRATKHFYLPTTSGQIDVTLPGEKDRYHVHVRCYLSSDGQNASEDHITVIIKD